MSVLLERQSIESLVMPKSGEHGLDHALARKELWNRLAGVTEKGGIVAKCGAASRVKRDKPGRVRFWQVGRGVTSPSAYPPGSNIFDEELKSQNLRPLLTRSETCAIHISWVRLESAPPL